MTPEVAGDRDRIGPYQLVKAIGAGGSARIDLARIDRAYGFQRHVVIKRPLEHLRGDDKAAASLRREASIGARLRHPNLVAILDAGVHDGYDYLVLEYVHGGSLRTLAQADAPARVRDCATNVAVAIVGDVARALHEAHELADDTGHPLGLVHRDVSPGNILVGLDGSVKLADFGIAKETRVQTLSGSMHGTVTYMAPEQCRGHAFDRRADVFSLGVILYELVTGTRLFWADNDVASLHRVLSGTVPRPRKLRPAIAPALEDIVMTAVAHEQDKRFTTARDLADALEIYAQEAGEILGARWIARWVQDILGPREAPWIGAPTVIDLPRAPSGDGPLVDIIESVPAEEPPPDPTFGPTAPSFADEIDTKPRRSSPRAARRRLAAVIALGLAGGAGVTTYVMTREPVPRDAAPNRASEPAAPSPAAPGRGLSNADPTGASAADPNGASPAASNSASNGTSTADPNGASPAASNGMSNADPNGASAAASKADPNLTSAAGPSGTSAAGPNSTSNGASTAASTGASTGASKRGATGASKRGATAASKAGSLAASKTGSGAASDETRDRVRRRRPPADKPGDKTADKPAATPTIAEQKPADKPGANAVPVEPKPADAAKDASKPLRGTPKVEWNPTMLLPTDSGSGTKKK